MRHLVIAATALVLAACTPAAGDVLTTSAPASSAAAAAATSSPSAVPTATVPVSPVPAPSVAPSPVPSVTASPAPSASAAPAPAPVGSFVLGDSISLSVAPQLSRLGYPVTGRVGQSASTAYLTEHLSTATAQAAPAWVIVLGTNNRGDASDVQAVAEWLDTIKGLRTKGARQHVYWVTPYRSPDYRGGMSTWTLDELDAELARQDAQLPWLDVLDFATSAAQHPEWFAQDGAHLHPDADGQAELVRLIAGPDATPAASPAPITDLTPPPTPTASPTPTPSADPVFEN